MKNNSIESPVVMLVDDDAIHNFINERILKMNGFTKEIYAYENALKALDFLKNASALTEPSLKLPDLIFLDIKMSLMDGHEFLDALSQHSPAMKKIKVIVLTLSFDPEDETRSRACSQVIDYIQKPLTPEFLDNLKQNGFI